ncbi:MAG: hypothetical protein ACI9XZ_004348 [Alphaproteobacteria bacterium]|jgi:hypothetical protein
MKDAKSECDTGTELTASDGASPGYSASRLNAVQHGILSRHAVLPWEDADEYERLFQALVAEHKPAGPTEEHLVEELVGVLWRKNRLRLAEASTYHRALKSTTDKFSTTADAALVLAPTSHQKVDVSEALKAAPDDTQRDLSDLEADRRMTEKALQILRSGKADSYDVALLTLHESTRSSWGNQLTWEADDYEADETPYALDAPSLLRFIETEIVDWYDRQREQIELRPRVRAQALGESLDPHKLERLGRYEVHLDRKFERTLSTLLRLQELRRSREQVADH